MKHRTRMKDEALEEGDYLVRNMHCASVETCLRTFKGNPICLMQGFLLLSEQAEWEIQMGRPQKAITYLDRCESSLPSHRL